MNKNISKKYHPGRIYESLSALPDGYSAGNIVYVEKSGSYEGSIWLAIDTPPTDYEPSGLHGVVLLNRKDITGLVSALLEVLL